MKYRYITVIICFIAFLGLVSFYQHDESINTDEDITVAYIPSDHEG